jgi:chromosome segregation ATPase
VTTRMSPERLATIAANNEALGNALSDPEDRHHPVYYDRRDLLAELDAVRGELAAEVDARCLAGEVLARTDAVLNGANPETHWRSLHDVDVQVAALKAELAAERAARVEAERAIAEMRGTPSERMAGMRRRVAKLVEEDPVGALTNVLTGLCAEEAEDAERIASERDAATARAEEAERLRDRHASTAAKVIEQRNAANAEVSRLTSELEVATTALSTLREAARTAAEDLRTMAYPLAARRLEAAIGMDRTLTKNRSGST